MEETNAWNHVERPLPCKPLKSAGNGSSALEPLERTATAPTVTPLSTTSTHRSPPARLTPGAFDLLSGQTPTYFVKIDNNCRCILCSLQHLAPCLFRLPPPAVIMRLSANFCGPKCSHCCFVLSIWGILMLVRRKREGEDERMRGSESFLLPCLSSLFVCLNGFHEKRGGTDAQRRLRTTWAFSFVLICCTEDGQHAVFLSLSLSLSLSFSLFFRLLPFP